MKKIVFLFAAALMAGALDAQDKTVRDLQAEAEAKTIAKDPADTIPKVWKDRKSVV